MKRLSLIILAAAYMLGLSSCSEKTIDTPQSNEGKAITFNNIATKAGLSDLQTDGFGVWATIDNSIVEGHVLMDNQYVEYKDGLWEYSPLRYWVPETEFNFIATYPYDASGTYYTFDSNTAAVKLTVAETPSQEDFLIATNLVDTSDESFDDTQSVNLDFHHMLTSVGLKIWRDGGKHQNDQMRIKQVTLSNISKSGSYSTDIDGWSLGTDKVTVQKVYENLADTDNIGAAIVNDDGRLDIGGNSADPFGVMMFIPQTLDPNIVSLKIQYQLKRQNAADWEDAELETYMPAATWESNKRYTYNVVLSSVTDITIYYIQTKVDPWGTPQVGGTVIIK